MDDLSDLSSLHQEIVQSPLSHAAERMHLNFWLVTVILILIQFRVSLCI